MNPIGIPLLSTIVFCSCVARQRRCNLPKLVENKTWTNHSSELSQWFYSNREKKSCSSTQIMVRQTRYLTTNIGEQRRGTLSENNCTFKPNRTEPRSWSTLMATKLCLTESKKILLNRSKVNEWNHHRHVTNLDCVVRLRYLETLKEAN